MILIILISSLIVKRIHKKNNEKLENANEKLNSFGKIVCHDASGPLTGIIALVDLIIEDYSEILPEDAQSSLSTVSSATFRLQTMLQDLYLFCNSQVGLKPELEDVDLNILANDIISDLQIQITESNATIVLKDLGTVRSGRSELRLALQNLISNAIKYIEKGKKPIVEIYMDGEMNLCVKDNGIGISEENYEKIFDPFSRLVGSDYDGTGLGLSTCQRLIRYTDGDVSVSSVKGEGSTFKISFQLTT
jgi:signal transduction histidine kinase